MVLDDDDGDARPAMERINRPDGRFGHRQSGGRFVEQQQAGRPIMARAISTSRCWPCGIRRPRHPRGRPVRRSRGNTALLLSSPHVSLRLSGAQTATSRSVARSAAKAPSMTFSVADNSASSLGVWKVWPRPCGDPGGGPADHAGLVQQDGACGRLVEATDHVVTSWSCRSRSVQRWRGRGPPRWTGPRGPAR